MINPPIKRIHMLQKKQRVILRVNYSNIKIYKEDHNKNLKIVDMLQDKNRKIIVILLVI